MQKEAWKSRRKIRREEQRIETAAACDGEEDRRLLFFILQSMKFEHIS